MGQQWIELALLAFVVAFVAWRFLAAAPPEPTPSLARLKTVMILGVGGVVAIVLLAAIFGKPT